MSYSEDITGEIFGAEDYGVKVELIADEAAGTDNPRDYSERACLVLPGGREYIDIDERGDDDKPGSDIGLGKMIRDPRYGWVDEEFDFCANWTETARRLRAHGCECLFVSRHGYDGSLSTWGGDDGDGAAGIIFATPEMMRRWHMKKRLTKEIRAFVRDELALEVSEYSKWATGDVWGVVIEDAYTGDELDSCWGLIGDEHAREFAREMAAPLIDERRKARELALYPWAAFDVPQLIA